MEQLAGTIWVGIAGDRVCIRVHGRATHLHGQPLRDFSKEMMRQGYLRFELDLEHCAYMDSTFLGVLVGISNRLTKAGAAPFRIYHLTPRNLDLFKTLGVDRFFRIESGPATAEPSPDLYCLTPKGSSKEERADAVLEAHENLVEADKRNEPRFKELLAFLREDVSAQTSASASTEGARPGRWKQ